MSRTSSFSCDSPDQLIARSATLAQATTVEAAITRAVELAETAFGGASVRLCEYDPETETVDTVESAGRAAESRQSPETLPSAVLEQLRAHGADRETTRASDDPTQTVATTRTELDGSVETEAVLPVGHSRVLCLGATESVRFDDANLRTAERIAAALETALDRIEGQAVADSNAEMLRRFHELTVGADNREFDATVDRLLSLGREHLDLETGILSRVEGTEYEIAAVVDATGTYEVGTVVDLGETLCEVTVDRGSSTPLAFADARATDYHDHPAVETVSAYIAAPVVVDGAVYGTVNFSSRRPRASAFRPVELEFVELVAQWVGSELERNHRLTELERYQTILEAVGDPVYALDADGRFTFVNEAAKRDLGYGEAVIGERPSVGMADADVERIGEQIQRLVEGDERSTTAEFELETASGDRRLVENRLALTGDDEFRGTAGILRDITARTERRRRLESFEQAIDEAADGVAVLEDGEYVYVDQTHVEMYGFDSREQLLGGTWRKLYDERETDRLEHEAFPVLEAEGHWRGMVTGSRPDGSTFPAELSLTAIDDGRLVCTVRDETERVEMERAREAAVTAFERAYEVTTDPERSFEEKVSGLLDVGKEYLDQPNGFLTRIETDPDGTGIQTIVDADGTHELLQPGESCPLPNSYCRKTIESEELRTITAAAETGWDGDPAHDLFGLDTYIGGEVTADGELYGTLCFASTEPREREFTETERSFVDLLRRWVSYELDQKTTREALRQERERLELVLSGTETGLADWDLETDAVEWNETLVDIVGRDVDSMAEFRAAVHPDDRERVQSGLERMLETGEPWVGEFRLRDADGDSLWLGTRAVPSHEDGDPVRVLATGTDITDRKHQERERRRNERRFESLFDDPEMLVGLVDTDGTLLNANQTAMEYVEAPREAVVGEPFWEGPWWAHSETLQRDLQEWLARAADGEYVTYSATHPGPGGETHHITGTVRPVTDTDGRVTSLLLSGRDVTERERQRGELERLTSRFEEFAEAVPSAFFLVPPDYSETLYVNSAAADLYGVDGETLAEDPASFLRHVHPDDMAAIEADMSTQQDGEMTGAQRQVFRVEHPDDGTRWLRSTIRPIRDETGAVDRLAGVTTDITKQRVRERRMVSLHGATRSLLDAETPAEAFEAGADAFDDTLGLAVAGFYQRVDDALVMAAGTGVEAVGAPERVTREQTQSPLWSALDAGEPIVYHDPSDIDDGVDRSAVGAVGYFPVGDRGVVAVGARDATVLDSGQRRLVEVLTGNLAAVLDALDRETSLRASRRRYRSLAENIPNGAVLTFDSDLTYRLAAGELLSELGFEASDISGRGAGTLFPDADISDELVPRFRAALDGERTDRRVEIGNRVVRVHVVPVPAGEQRSGDVYGLVLAQDVTEEARRERELSRERERFRLLTESVDEYAFVVVGPDGNIRTWNEGAQRLFGYDAETALGMSMAKLHPPAERESDLPERLLEQARVAGESGHEGWRVRADGSEFYADVRHAPLETDDGEFRGYAKVVRDMTDRRRQQRRTERFVEESTDVVTIVDTDGTISYASGSADRVLGHDSDDLVGENLFDFLHPDSREHAMQTFFECVDGAKNVKAECRLESPDGGWINVEGRCRNMLDDEAIEGVLVYLRDVTESKKRARRFESIFNQTYQFTGLLEPDGTVIEANDAALEFGGIGREAITGERFDEAPWWSHDEAVAADVRDAIDRAAAGEFVRYETEVNGADGLGTIDFSVKPVFDEDETVTLLVVEGRDITSQQQHRRHLEVLQRVLRHNMRNDLMKMRGWTEMIVEADDHETRAERFEPVERTLDKWESMTDKIGEIRQLLRSQREHQSTREAGPLVADATSAVAEAYPDATVTADVSAGDSVRAPATLSKAVTELVTNAAKSTTAPTVSVELSRPEAGWLAVDVRDDGPGIPEMEADVLESGEESPLEHGQGLGLWMVRVVATQAGGDVTVEADSGGTVVSVRLPVESAPGTERVR